MPLPVEETCGRCKLKATKPEACPVHLAEYVDFLETLARRHKLGVIFNEDEFNRYELEAIDGKADALSKYEQLKDIRQRRESANKTAPGAKTPGQPADLAARMRRVS